MTKVRAVVVDDDATEAGALAEILDGEGLGTTLQAPSSTVETTTKEALGVLGETGPRILLLDYRLGDNALADGSSVAFKGGSVAEYVREQDPDVPIVLLTSEENLHEWVERRPGIKEIFDWELIKNMISAEGGADEARAKIIDYANAWETVRNWTMDTLLWEALAELMSAPEREMELFEELEAEPPGAAMTAEVLHWVLFDALRTPGPLIDTDTARVALGLNRDSFDKSEVAKWLTGAEYVGALKSFEDRWWGRRLRGQLAEAAGGNRPLDASARVAALSGVLKVDLQWEGCNWCGGERTLQACHQCGRATDAAHSIRPRSRPLPAWADSWVVCYSCIADGSADDITFPQTVQDIVDALIEGRIQPPGK
jgi:CheY-like chemotaxis protein